MKSEKVEEFGDKRWNQTHGCYEILEDDGQEEGGVWRLEKEYRGSDSPAQTAEEPNPRAGLDFESGGLSNNKGSTAAFFGELGWDEDADDEPK